MEEKFDIRNISQKIIDNYKKFGWKCGDGNFTAWKEEENVYITIDFNEHKKKPTKKQLEQVKNLFKANNAQFFGKEFIQNPFVVLTFRKTCSKE